MRPFFGLEGGNGFFGFPQVFRAQLLKPFPEFDQILMSGHNLARARYEALGLKVERRFSNGLTLLSHFTLSKNRDSVGSWNFFNNAYGSTAPPNSYDYDAEYSLAVNHTPRRFVALLTYELPFGRAKPLLNRSRFARAVAGSWQLNIVGTLQTGFPLTVSQAQWDVNLFAGAGVRPNATGVSPDLPGRPQDKLNGYINPDAFSPAPRFSFGNLARTIPNRSPAQDQWDVSLFKMIKIRERVNAQFRAEAFNFTNTPRFGPPNNLCVGCGSFGYITQQVNYPRFIQLGGRIYW